ncbi:MAG: endonuclease/exonuclease/phosphatase family protein [Bacteroides sp.]|jgi:endonuclease/exonuclease/phosphatase family metal-dependent hydrolase|nr:endonuclease/exonuclease/phosphatase family protein [Bacteroides sp.]
MKTRLFLLIIWLFPLFLFLSCSKREIEIKVISFNVRFDNPGDGNNAWPNRIPLVKQYLEEESPDIIGFQEALHHQVEDLSAMLPGYDWVGSGRDDGKEQGEYTPVFFKKSEFELADKGQFWLSYTPEIPGSIGPGALLPRITTWAKLIHKPSKTSLYFFNTHFSHVSDEARQLSAEIIAEKMKQIAGKAPLILTGDFNIEYGSDTYQLVSQQFLAGNQLINTFAKNMEENTAELPKTYNGFSEANTGAFIDFIFTKKSFSIKGYSVDKVKAGDIFISDHWPVKILLELKK